MACLSKDSVERIYLLRGLGHSWIYIAAQLEIDVNLLRKYVIAKTDLSIKPVTGKAKRGGNRKYKCKYKKGKGSEGPSEISCSKRVKDRSQEENIFVMVKHDPEVL